ncbi:hypothetical protein TNCV_5094401 [Trichonephila clavipes]|nr:hypothetical protein TNCV_5094401 [Trichonephila clavipes]
MYGIPSSAAASLPDDFWPSLSFRLDTLDTSLVLVSSMGHGGSIGVDNGRSLHIKKTKKRKRVKRVEGKSLPNQNWQVAWQTREALGLLKKPFPGQPSS